MFSSTMNVLLSRSLHSANVSKLFLKSFPKRQVLSNDFINGIRNSSTHSKPIKKSIDPMGIFLLTIPVSAFCLGTWQVQRLKWKTNLIAELQKRTTAPAQEFPENLYDLEDLEYHRVKITGSFDHSKEMFIGPRPLLINGDVKDNQGSMLSSGQSGYLVITPFKFEDRDLTILVNRGWIPRKSVESSKREDGQVEGTVTLSGIVRKTENRPQFMPKHNSESIKLNYRDVPKMAEMAGTAPIFLDAVESEPSGPIGGQTRANLRNEHLSYIFTWYTLCLFTSYLWHSKFIKVRTIL